MGWWKDGENLLGDGPADLFQGGLTVFGGEHGKPSWQQMLDALDAVLKAGRLHAEFAPGTPPILSNTKDAKPALREILKELIEQIREEYRERREREATLAEILGTVKFSLGGRPESFLSAPAASIKNLWVEKAA